MITNADITLYNHYYNRTTRLDQWKRTVIKGVHFYVDHRTAVGDNGVNLATTYKIRIPDHAEYDGDYVSKKEWVESGTDVAGKWTLQNGDLIVRGICEEEIEKPADLTSSGIRYCRISSWSDNRFGGLPHWRIGGD